MTALELGAWEVSFGDASSLPLNIFLLQQEHGAKIVEINSRTSHKQVADGFLLQESKIIGGIQTADCVPFVLVTDKSALALHVSRHTLLAGLLEQIPQLLTTKDINGVYIGPHICAKHFTFVHSDDALLRFEQKFPYACQHKEGTLHISLRKVLSTYLAAWRIDQSCVQEDKRCTFEDPSLYSYRRWLLDKTPGVLPRHITAVQRM